MKMEFTRREFIQKSSILSAALPFVPLFSQANQNSQKLYPDNELEIHIFSKHLQFLNYNEMAEAAAEMGFAGLDITVRPNGHVLPENAKKDLPKAVKAIKDAGLKATTITTAISSADEPYTKDILETASDLGINYYRSNWLHYSEEISIPKAMQSFQTQIKKLSELNKQTGIIGAYQNHSGRYVGAAIWEVWELLKDSNPHSMGCQYDIRHATVEGGKSWQTGLRLIAPKIKTIVLKDFKWMQTDKGWEAVNVPIGEGMVNFTEYFSLLKKYNIQVPVSLHMEYDLGGAEHGGKDIRIPKEEIFMKMKKDLNSIQALWKSV
ncbi:MAG: endonuclease [Thalassobius sp.]|nr:endonuclease [Thalassovita sp.]